MHRQAIGKADEIQRLQRCVNDLLSLLALPAIWSGNPSSHIVRTLLDSLVRLLHLDFVYVRLTHPVSDEPDETVRVDPSMETLLGRQDLCALLRSSENGPTKSHLVLPNSLGPKLIPIFSLQIGAHGEIGFIVAGSQRSEFPDQVERLVLGVAANQAYIGLREARLLNDQRLVADELDRRVAERTGELARANDDLRKEMAERRKMEERLLESESLLEEAQQLSHTGSWKHHLTSNEFTFSPEIARIFVIEGNAEASAPELFFSHVHPEDRDGVLSDYANALREKRGFQADYRILLPDGSTKHIHNTGHPKLNAAGDLVEFLGTAMDVTEQYLVREKLQNAFDEIRKSEAKLRRVIDTIPTLSWCNLPDGPNEFLSKGWHEYTGLSPEESHGWGWQASFHPDDLPPLMNRWQELLVSGEPGEIEARLRRHDGVYRWFLIRVEAFRDEAGNIVRWYGTSTDIDDRKKAEEQLRRSEAFLAEGQNLSRVGNFSWLVATDEIKWSEQLYRIFELEPGVPVTFDLIGSRVHPEDLTLLYDMIAQAKRSVTDFAYEHRLLLPDGSVKHLHLIAHANHDGEGRLEYIGAVQDVTQRRLSEEALGKARAELTKTARMNSLGVLTASIAHEVNQPLSGIITNASTCLRMLSADPPNVDGARETARRTIRDGNRASDVIARLRTLFSKKDLSPECMDLNEAAREVASMSLGELQRNRVVLRYDLAEDLPPVTADRVQLQQVILNLLRNASDAMSTVEGRPRELLIRTEREDEDRVRLSIKDTGVGFAAPAADKLFEAFYTTKNDGMGIGLSISRSIIEAHRGRLWAAPNDGPGALFAFSIPCNPAAEDSRLSAQDAA